jgi:hypothetical protein
VGDCEGLTLETSPPSILPDASWAVTKLRLVFCQRSQQPLTRLPGLEMKPNGRRKVARLQPTSVRASFAEPRRAAVDFAIRARSEGLIWMDLWVVTAVAAQQMEAQPKQ